MIQQPVSLRGITADKPSPGLRAVVRLQETIHACLMGRQPEPHWIGPVSGAQFLQVVFELIDILTHRTTESRLVLADLLVPDEFRRAYNVGGRFDNPQLSTLPWFARFLIFAALNRLLQAFAEAPVQSPMLMTTVDHLLSRFLGLLASEQMAAILSRTGPWPSSLKMAFHRAATMVRQPPHAVHRLSTILRSETRGIPPVTYNKFTL